MCRRLYVDEEPPCEECITEPLLDENVDAVNVYFAVRNQLRAIQSGDGVFYELDAVAIWMTIDGFGIKNRMEVFEKVQILGREFSNR